MNRLVGASRPTTSACIRPLERSKQLLHCGCEVSTSRQRRIRTRAGGDSDGDLQGGRSRGDASSTGESERSSSAKDVSSNGWSVNGSLPSPDKAAAMRLKSLLANIGDGEADLLNMELRSLDPGSKTVLCVVAGSLVTSGALVICWLAHASPLGGASFSLSSAAAAVTGVVAGAPFAGLKAVMWGREVRSKLPAVDYLLMQEFDYFEPLLTGMSGWQAAVVLTAEVLPPLLVVLPAAQSGLAMAYAVYATDVFNQALGLGVDVPAVSETLALLTTAALAAIGQLLNVKVSQEEVTAIKEAMENADRYYRLTATGPGAPADWEGMSRSFKEVAKKYLSAMEVASQLAAMFTAGEVIYLGLLWRATDDLWAPFMAALVVLAVDIAYIRRVIKREASF